MWFLNNIIFKNSEVLYALLLIPALIVLYILVFSKGKPVLQFPNISFFKIKNKSFRQRLRHILFVLRMLALSAVIIALARPQSMLSREEISVEGVDIMIALDVSGSMLAEDFKPNRLEAAKQVAKQFIENRKNDRIGLVIFAGEAFTQCPLTTDHNMLISILQGVSNQMVEDGTAIGDGLATALNRIKDSKAVSKTIILLTDGENNMGSLDPQTSAEMTALYGIRLYTIGVGKYGHAPFPFRTADGRIRYENVEVSINEPLMRRMANLTDGGTYFRATDEKSLQQIFSDIDQMEKSKIDVTQYNRTKEEFFPFLLFALICFGLELLLGLFFFRTMP